MRVAVTGAAGELGSVLVERLVRAGFAVRAIDLRPAAPGVESVVRDVRDPALAADLSGCETVVHLAYVVEPSHNPARDMAVNVEGTKNVARAARQAGAGHFVFASSISAYGNRPEYHDRWLDETAPLRAEPGFPYAYSKRLAEAWLDEFERETPGLTVTRMRPCLFAGPRSHKQIIYGLQSVRVLAYCPEYDAPIQLAHVEDVAQAFQLAVEKRVGGAFNVAVRDPLPPSRLAKLSGCRTLRVPRPAADLGMELLWRLRILKMSPPWFRIGVRYSILASIDRARRELGWSPRYSTSRETALALFGPAKDVG